MKTTLGAIVLGIVLVVVSALPKPDDRNGQAPKTEVDFVPLEAQDSGFLEHPGIVDVDTDYGFFGPPPAFFNNFQGLFTRLRQQLDELLGRVPIGQDGGVSPFGDIDLGKGNTTSVTKVINGHKVTINDTEYRQESENGGSFLKVRIIDFHPDDNSTETIDNDSREPLAEDFSKPKESKENEEFENIESFDDVDHHHPQTRRRTNPGTNGNRWPGENFETNEIRPLPPKRVDLSHDIYVNDLAAMRGVPYNPDAEVFDVVDNGLDSHYPPPSLEHDTYVNTILANSGVAPNPDAEVFVPSQHQPQSQYSNRPTYAPAFPYPHRAVHGYGPNYSHRKPGPTYTYIHPQARRGRQEVVSSHPRIHIRGNASPTPP